MPNTRELHEIKTDIDVADEEYTLNWKEEDGDFLTGYNENRAALLEELENWYANHSN